MMSMLMMKIGTLVLIELTDDEDDDGYVIKTYQSQAPAHCRGPGMILMYN